MKKYAVMMPGLFLILLSANAQVEKNAGNWKPWFISSVKDHRLSKPSSAKSEIDAVVAAQRKVDEKMRNEIEYWNAGDAGYRWKQMITKLWLGGLDTAYHGMLANLLVNVANYDAIIVAWDTKYAFNRARPYDMDPRIQALILKAESPSYPCEHSVAAGVAATIISKFYPQLTDSVNRMAQRSMNSRIAAGMAFPSDTRDGFELGKRIAEKAIDHTKDFMPATSWDRKQPTEPGKWQGKYVHQPLLGKAKTVVLTSGSQFRPGPPPDFVAEMAELKNFKQTFNSRNNAFYWATGDFWTDYLSRKIFEKNIHLNAPRAARLHAITSIALYDALIACWDSKYTYWGIRPNQYDTTYRPLIPTPPFPGYTSGHAVSAGVMSEMLIYFFPEDKILLLSKAKEAAESRFQGGIHFRTDNQVGLDIGRKVAGVLIDKIRNDGSSLASVNDQRKEIKTPSEK